MRIGLIHPKFRVEPSRNGHEWHSFAISPNTISDRDLLDSQAASPSRYLVELVQRIEERAGDSRAALLVFNPLLLLHVSQIQAVVDRMEREVAPGMTVVEDRTGQPIAYRLPGGLGEDVRFLLLLSCTRGVLDERVLSTYFGDARRLTLRFRVGGLTNGFAAGNHLRPCEWAAEHACRVLESRLEASSVPPSPEERLRARRTLGFSAFMPHHAGDVLLLALASRHAPKWFNGLVVNASFADLLQAAGSDLVPQEIVSASPPYRDDNAVDDPEYFAQVAPQLKSDRLYVYLRTSRYATVTDFHLIDHFAFALGRRYRTPNDLVSWLPTPCRQKDFDGGKIRVLLHFDGGWHLKRYPATLQRRLVDWLHQLDVDVTVLDRSAPDLNCRTTSFESLTSFSRLLDEHHLLIGMDSFPAHYASRVVGMPTLALFANTHWINYGAPLSGHYQPVESGLDCCPCVARDTCPRFGVEECMNFAEPETVVLAAISLLDANYRLSPATARLLSTGEATLKARAPSQGSPSTHLPSSRQPQFLRPEDGIRRVRAPSSGLDAAVNQLSCRALDMLAPGAKGVSLVREYVHCCRDHGLWMGNFLLKTYIARAFRNGKPGGMNAA